MKSLLHRRRFVAVLLTSSALTALPHPLPADTVIPYDSPLIPAGLRPGDSFHLMFVSSGGVERDLLDGANDGSDNATVAQWDAHVNAVADASTLAGIGAINWFALVSVDNLSDGLPGTAAKDRVVTTAPIYRTDKVFLASNSTDFWDGSLAVAPLINEHGGNIGTGSTDHFAVWSGDKSNYTSFGQIGTLPLGNGTGAAQVGFCDQAANNWFSFGDHMSRGPDSARRVYALSERITIAIPPDGDNDGLPDWFELAHTTPSSSTAMLPGDDLDQDGLTNLQEYQAVSYLNPISPDTDADGLLDGASITVGTSDPRHAAWAAAGIAYFDSGTNRTFRGETTMGTHPVIADTDGDGLRDGVESNTGIWVSPTNTGTNPLDNDTDNDALKDNVETNTGTYVGKTDTGTNPNMADTDGDTAGDWYEITATLTSPVSAASTPNIPYPLPDPDNSIPPATNKPVKVFILSGQSNMVGIGYVTGPKPGSLDAVTKVDGKFPNLLDAGGNYLPREDVWYEGVIKATAKKWLAPGCGANSTQIGPELGFGQIMGWYHEEPVLIIKASEGNRGLGWNFLAPGATSFPWTDGRTYAGYGDSPEWWTTGSTPVPHSWYGGKDYDMFFRNETDWARPTDPPVTNVVDVLDNFATKFTNWAAQGFQIAGFGWFQGHWDLTTGEPYATKYEENLARLITQTRAYFQNRYPGKVAPDTPFAVATVGFGYLTYDDPNSPQSKVLNAQLNVGNPALHPEFAGTVKSVDTRPYWRETSESPGVEGYHYHNNAETYMLVGDALGRLMIDMIEGDDILPPAPNPPTFAITPAAVNATTIGMVATAATDRTGPVQYYFENTTNGSNSGWISGTRWDNTGLTPGQTYDYRFKTRDGVQPVPNESSWSATLAATAQADTTAPSPDPMTFSSPPAATGPNSITMTASTASDINGVQYFFDCIAGGGPDSGWQSGVLFNANGLTPNTSYTYVVRAKDAAGNTTANSAPASATTSSPDILPEIANPNFDPPDEDTSDNSGVGYGPISSWIRSGTSSGVNSVSQPFLEQNPHSGTHSAFIQSTGHIAQNLTGYDATKPYTVTYFVSERGYNSGTAPVTSTSVSLDDGATWHVQPDPIRKTAQFRRIVSGPLPVSGTTSTLRIAATAVAGDTSLLIDTVTLSRAVPRVPDGGFESPLQPGTGASGYKLGNGGGSGTLTGSLWNFGATQNGITRNGSSYSAAAEEYAPEGSQAAMLLGTGEFSTTVAGFEPGVTYTLSFAAKGRAGSFGPNALQVRLGGELLAFSGLTSITPGQSAWTTFTSDAFTTAGGNLELRITGLTSGDKTTFLDDFRFNFVAEAPVSGSDFHAYISNPAFGLDPAEQGFGLDPDGDGLENGIEAWFGTHPGEFSQGLVAGTKSGNTFTFTHPVNGSPPVDLTAAYRWSKDLANFHAAGATSEGTTVTIIPGTPSGGFVTVTATVTGTPLEKLFLDLMVMEN